MNWEFSARKLAGLSLALVLVFADASEPATATGIYAWRPEAQASAGTLVERIAPPSGFERLPAEGGSFAAWLRSLPLTSQDQPVRLFDGTTKPRQDVHAAIIDIDAGQRDLQQCADAIMRLRAEWQFATGRQKDIGFNFTGGGRVDFARYAKGQRPDAKGRRWTASAKPDASYPAFRKYMDLVFAYAGTASLEKELKSVPEGDVEIGDVFIKGGFPGHAVLVVDIAINPLTRSKRMLLLQSYMPAQDMHVLKNFDNGDGSPWYQVPSSELKTPEWTFPAGSLRRWP